MSLTASRLSALAVLALPLVSARSLGAQRGGDVSVSRNVRVSTRNAQDVVSESWIAADPVDAHHLLACAMASSASAQRRSPVRITR